MILPALHFTIEVLQSHLNKGVASPAQMLVIRLYSNMSLIIHLKPSSTSSSSFPTPYSTSTISPYSSYVHGKCDSRYYLSDRVATRIYSSRLNPVLRSLHHKLYYLFCMSNTVCKYTSFDRPGHAAKCCYALRDIPGPAFAVHGLWLWRKMTECE